MSTVTPGHGGEPPGLFTPRSLLIFVTSALVTIMSSCGTAVLTWIAAADAGPAVAIPAAVVVGLGTAATGFFATAKILHGLVSRNDW